MIRGKTAFVRYMALISLLTLIACFTMPVAAQSTELDFGAYAYGANLNNVRIPGVTFIIPNGTTITVNSPSSLDIQGAAGVDLIIRFPSRQGSFSLITQGYGNCQTGPDYVNLYLGSTQTYSHSIFMPPAGRCITESISQTANFTEIQIDVQAGDAIYLYKVTVDPNPEIQGFTDGRINAYDAATPVVLYAVDYGNEAYGLHIYAADNRGLLLEINPETIQAVAECPDSNTLIIEDNTTGIRLYRLASDSEGNCAFQLLAPTSSGKTYIIIFDSLSPNTNYRSWEEE